MRVKQQTTGDRRAVTLTATQNWDRLNNAQRFACYTLGKLGYQLQFVRFIGDRRLAITRQQSHLATVDEAGEIDFNPGITIRH